MNVLIIISNPTRASYRQRIKVYLDIMRSNGVVAHVEKLPRNPLQRKELFKKALDYDCVLLHKKALNYLNAIWLKRYSKIIIYDFDDAIMFNAEQPEKYDRKRQNAFKRIAEMSNMIIAGCPYLAEQAKVFNKNVYVLPTGLNTKIFNEEYSITKDDKIRLVWIGSKSTVRYLKEIKPALEEIGSRFNNVVLRIICDTFIDLENMPVEKKEWSLETQVPDLLSSDIGLAPLTDNIFTRGKCGFKILQYASAGLPVVTTPIGVNADYVRDNISGFHATSISEWIEKTSILIKDSELRKKMGQAGKEDVAKYDLDVIGEKLAKFILKYDPNRENENIKKDHNTDSLQKTVSVCIPTYNRKEYLKETIKSILEQTYKDYEIVIVDDGSTDGTEQMIKKLGIPVTYHWQKNSGDASARNKLIELAKGRYISFIDSDDLLLPDTLERLVKAIENEKGQAVAYGSYYRIDKNGEIYGRCKRKLYSGFITKHLFKTIFIHACGSMFPIEMLRKAPAFDTSLHICSDYDLWLRLSTKYRFIGLPEPTFKRRRHETNLSKASVENVMIEYQVCKRFYESGGKEYIPPVIAKYILGKKQCKAGRYAIKEGMYEKACELLNESFSNKPSIKSFIYLIKAKLLKRINNSSEGMHC
ncbi:MAG: glycosyltransferase [Sedimentisphaerales bacterium]|nr:glycosyltransferase [Sedimentisphaerales bacterium]